MATFCLHVAQLFSQLFLFAVRLGKRGGLLLNHRFQLGFLRLLRFLRGSELIHQRIAGGRLIRTLLLHQTVQANPCCQRNGDGNRAQREARFVAAVFLLSGFLQSSLAVASSPQSPWSLQPRRRICRVQ